MPAAWSLAFRKALPRRPRGFVRIGRGPALLAWLVLAAAVFGAAHAVCGTLERQFGPHAAVPATKSAWEGAEQVRRYLEKADENTLGHLSGDMDIAGIDGLSFGVVSVVEGKAGAYRVTANIADAGKPVLQVVYDVVPPPGSGDRPASIDAITVYGDLDVTGGIKVLGGTPADLEVAGNVSLERASVDGIRAIRATGSVTVGSGVHVDRIDANGDVTVTGTASAGAISALGDVTIGGGAGPFAVVSNGTVTFNGGSASSVRALGDVVVAAGGVSIASIDTMRSVHWTGRGGGAGSIRANGSVLYAGSNRGTSIRAIGDVSLIGAGAQSVATRGNVTLDGFGSIGQLAAQGDLGIDGWGGVSGAIGGRLDKAIDSMPASIVLRPGLTVDVAPIALAALPPVAIARPAIDADALNASANYAFENIDGAIRVTVSHVAGIDSGTYFLGGYPRAGGRGDRDFLCSALAPGTLARDGKGRCDRPAMPHRTICKDDAPRGDCLSYLDGAWTMRGENVARGALRFRGDLTLRGTVWLDLRGRPDAGRPAPAYCTNHCGPGVRANGLPRSRIVAARNL